MENREILRFLDETGKVVRLPAKRKKKILVLAYLAGRIPSDAVYTERDFNALLNGLHAFDDPATLRRELFDYYQIKRKPDGSEYQLNPDRPSAEELFERYCK